MPIIKYILLFHIYSKNILCTKQKHSLNEEKYEGKEGLDIQPEISFTESYVVEPSYEHKEKNCVNIIAESQVLPIDFMPDEKAIESQYNLLNINKPEKVEFFCGISVDNETESEQQYLDVSKAMQTETGQNLLHLIYNQLSSDTNEKTSKFNERVPYIIDGSLNYFEQLSNEDVLAKTSNLPGAESYGLQNAKDNTHIQKTFNHTDSLNSIYNQKNGYQLKSNQFNFNSIDSSLLYLNNNDFEQNNIGKLDSESTEFSRRLSSQVDYQKEKSEQISCEISSLQPKDSGLSITEQINFGQSNIGRLYSNRNYMKHNNLDQTNSGLSEIGLYISVQDDFDQNYSNQVDKYKNTSFDNKESESACNSVTRIYSDLPLQTVNTQNLPNFTKTSSEEILESSDQCDLAKSLHIDTSNINPTSNSSKMWPIIDNLKPRGEQLIFQNYTQQEQSARLSLKQIDKREGQNLKRCGGFLLEFKKRQRSALPAKDVTTFCIRNEGMQSSNVTTDSRNGFLDNQSKYDYEQQLISRRGVEMKGTNDNANQYVDNKLEIVKYEHISRRNYDEDIIILSHFFKIDIIKNKNFSGKNLTEINSKYHDLIFKNYFIDQKNVRRKQKMQRNSNLTYFKYKFDEDSWKERIKNLIQIKVRIETSTIDTRCCEILQTPYVCGIYLLEVRKDRKSNQFNEEETFNKPDSSTYDLFHKKEHQSSFSHFVNTKISEIYSYIKNSYFADLFDFSKYELSEKYAKNKYEQNHYNKHKKENCKIPLYFLQKSPLENINQKNSKHKPNKNVPEFVLKYYTLSSYIMIATYEMEVHHSLFSLDFFSKNEVIKEFLLNNFCYKIKILHVEVPFYSIYDHLQKKSHSKNLYEILNVNRLLDVLHFEIATDTKNFDKIYLSQEKIVKIKEKYEKYKNILEDHIFDFKFYNDINIKRRMGNFFLFMPELLFYIYLKLEKISDDAGLGSNAKNKLDVMEISIIGKVLANYDAHCESENYFQTLDALNHSIFGLRMQISKNESNFVGKGVKYLYAYALALKYNNKNKEAETEKSKIAFLAFILTFTLDFSYSDHMMGEEMFKLIFCSNISDTKTFYSQLIKISLYLIIFA